jgi:hypothetical protein
MKFTKTYFAPTFLKQSEVYITYEELEEIFGKPFHGPGKDDTAPSDLSLTKTTCQWRIKFEDGTVALIYDNRQQYTPRGMYNWWIGGMTGSSVQRVLEVIKQHREQVKNKQQE